MKELKFLNKYFWKYKYRLILGILFIVISNYFAVEPVEYVKKALDLVTHAVVDLKSKNGSVDTAFLVDQFGSQIVIYGLLILGMALLRGLFLFFMRQTIIVMSRLIEFDLKNEVYLHYQTLPLSFYRRNNTGDLMSRISEDINKVRMYLGPAIMYLINMIVLFCFCIWHMVAVNPMLTLYVLTPLPILSFLIYKVNFIMEERSEVIQRHLAGLSTFVQETFSGIRVIKAFVREDKVIDQFAEASNKYKEASLSLTKVNAYFQPLIIGLIGLSTVLTIYLGGIEVTRGSITTGNIAQFVIFVNMLAWPVTSLGWTISLIQTAEASQKRINEFLETKTDIISKTDLIVPIEGAIEFRNVSLTYPDSGIEALKNISFKIPLGKSLGVLGSTGSGKSTLANLICRMYDPTTGKVLVDNHDFKDLNPQNLRHYIGYVPQDVFLFSDSIRNNIAFGGDENNEENIIKAAKQADLYDNVMGFEKQFETIIGERGITLSGGQKQRTSIARALIKNPRILILDDCLSAVDTNTENTILNNLSSVVGSTTSVIISHRISSLKLADSIIVLDAGRIVEEGTHEELVQKENGVYKALYDKQMKGEETPSVE